MRTSLRAELWLAILGTLLTSACGSLLPKGETATPTLWDSYESAHAAFDKIIPNETTTHDLWKQGIAPHLIKNVALLSNIDLARRVLPNGVASTDYVDPSLHDCLAAKQRCRAYEIEQKQMDRKRIGNFWLDFLNFERSTDIVGRRFDAIIVFKDDLVVYKVWN